MLWDLPGGGVAPSMAGGDDALDVSTQGYVNSMQLHTMSCVVVVVGLHDTEVALNVVNACHEDHVPLVLVQTHVDELVRDALKKEGRQVDAESLHARLESLLEGRRAYLRQTYQLTEQDALFLTNLTPYTDPDVHRALDRAEASCYELPACLSAILNRTHDRHAESRDVLHRWLDSLIQTAGYHLAYVAGVRSTH